MDLKPPRFMVQKALAHFMSLTQIVSKCEGESEFTRRTIYACEVMFRTHLFNDLTQEEAQEVFGTARDEQIKANESETLDELNAKLAKILAMSGYSRTAVAAMLDYMAFWDEFDDVRRSYIDVVCAEAGENGEEVIKSLSPSFDALYKYWSDQ